MKLSQQQLNLFNDFGFLVFRGLLSREEMELYSREFNAGLDSWIEGGKHDGKSSPLRLAHGGEVTIHRRLSR